MPSVTITSASGRPVITIDGKPHGLPTYSPISWRPDFLQKSGPPFFKDGIEAYWLALSDRKAPCTWGESPFWHGDEIRDPKPDEFAVDPDAQARFILEGDPGAWLLIRNLPVTAPSWNELHPDQLFLDEEGKRHNVPSFASTSWWESSAAAGAAGIRFCESRPWADRVIGYWFGLDYEGTPPWLFEGKLFDHSPVMTARWRDWLREKYGTMEALRTAYADESLDFETIQVPRDRLRGRTEEVAAIRYWEAGPQHQPLADYLELMGLLFRQGASHVFQTLRAATPEPRLILTDAFKQAMAGWQNFAFFNPSFPYPLAWPETIAGAGNQGVAELLDNPALDGVITPLDYQLRGVGGITEPEGIVDSVVLRGKAFFAECDIRTYHDNVEKGSYGTARDLAEFQAINWRNIATALTRGFNPYWMDIVGDWYGDPAIHRTIARSAEVLRESASWPHTTVPGIAVIIDDRSVLDTNANGSFLHQSILGDLKTGLSRCGVPYRIYLLEDLALDQFPEHRVFYFPNLFKATPEKLALLKAKVFHDGHLVLWGPGSGISDGKTIGVDSAAELTGFSFDWLDINDPRLVQITDFDHPITATLSEDTFYGSPLAYGPLMTPSDGRQLATCHGRSGKYREGLSIKDFRTSPLDPSGWISLFSATAPLPASLWRNIARFAGAHVYSETNDILLASREVVGLHSIKSGPKEILLPEMMNVRDLVSGESMGNLDRIAFNLNAPETRVFGLQNITR